MPCDLPRHASSSGPDIPAGSCQKIFWRSRRSLMLGCRAGHSPVRGSRWSAVPAGLGDLAYIKLSGLLVYHLALVGDQLKFTHH